MRYFCQHHNHSILNLDFKDAIFMPIGKITDITAFLNKVHKNITKNVIQSNKKCQFLKACLRIKVKRKRAGEL
jgi:NRPS condensation-like uncharacterized protein